MTVLKVWDPDASDWIEVGAPQDAVTLEDVYPVDSVYISYSSTNPGTTFGFGTWSRVAEGRFIAGVDTGGGTQWDDSGEEWGAAGHNHAVTDNVAHTHTGPSHNHTGPSHTHTEQAWSSAGGTVRMDRTSVKTGFANTNNITVASGTGGTGYGGTGNTGSSGAASATGSTNAYPPYTTMYIWRRTA